MWKILQKSPPFFVKYAQDSEDLHVDITDYQKCWKSDFNRKTLLNNLKECNDGLEFDDDNELIDRGIDMLSDPESLKKVTIFPKSNGSLNIVMTKQYEIALKLELILEESSSEHFFQVIIQPLLKTICDLRSSQHELRAALLKKDREIEEYKIEGRAPRRLITTIYDDVSHMSKHTSFEDCFGAKDAEISELLKSAIEAKAIRKPVPKIKEDVSANATTSIENGTKTEPSPKIEKCSQETETKTNPISTQIKDNLRDLIGPTEAKIAKTDNLVSDSKPIENKIAKTETMPVRKRPRNRLNL